MNPNIFLALLERKGIITREEALAVADHVNTSAQSTYYVDAYKVLEEFIDGPKLAPSAPILPRVRKLADAKPE